MKGTRWPVVLLRDCGALQSFVSKKCLDARDYVDTLEYRLIQGILGQPNEVPLVEAMFESDKLSGQILCGLVDTFPHGIDFLIGNDLQEQLHLHVSLVTRARKYSTDRNAVVASNSDPNDLNTNVHLHTMTNTNDAVVNGTVPNHRNPNDRDPARVLTDDTDEDASEENVMLEEQSELHPNASDNADAALQAEYDRW